MFVDDFDLATLAALRYARSLRPTSLRAVHFVLDSTQAAGCGRTGCAPTPAWCSTWSTARTGGWPRRRPRWCRPRRVLPGVGVTAVLPRRSYAPLLGRLLHDRTADRIASVVSQIPHAAATIVPFDVRTRVESTGGQGAGPRGRGRPSRRGWPGRPGGAEQADLTAPPADGARPPAAADEADGVAPEREPALGAPTPPEPPEPSSARDGRSSRTTTGRRRQAGRTPIGRLPKRGRATVEGRVHAVEIRPVERNTVLACEIVDSTGQLTAMFYGRSHIPGLDPGAKVRFTGQVGTRGREAVMINPAYELLAAGGGDQPLP